jgi:L-threonylcarbamoyladenylate synthase
MAQKKAVIFKSLNDPELITLIKGGAVGVLPTDTLYGVVARAADKDAVARMYALKQREHKPGTVIAANVQQLIDLGVPEKYLHRVEQWWPNSLSVEIPLGSELAYLHQETGRQGFRVVADEEVQRLLKETGPLVTSSANQPGEAPATTVEEACSYFLDKADYYVDGGDRSGRLPSTIARVTDEGIEIIRQGVVVIPAEALISGTSQSCPFCLSNGLLKTPILYEDEALFVTRPMDAPQDFLIIPRVHAERLTDLPDLWWKNIKAAFQGLPATPEAYDLSLNYGRAAGQTVRHLHFWIIPRDVNEPSAGKGLAALLSDIKKAQ